ncbi:MAG: complex I NDUFA9 subunit family protein [Betaproteobacteria bacterium HGW-Betaproteobacteria-8]|nr:MAG: complex I NDUFA9 subunit family protein [Betaproteobacteria bacterium HGW-Betaproteobacteria-8]
MRINQVCVLGGSGFVGSAIVHKLSAAGYAVKVLSRRREGAKHLTLLPNVQVAECDVFNNAELSMHMQSCDAVINLVGILHEGKNVTFDAMHHNLPKRIAVLCERLGIKRLLHMSALQTSAEAPSAYLRSKAAGETAVMAHSKKINVTIFQPSVIFGRGDNFLNMLATVVKLMPVIALAKPDARFQPIWVEDVAEAFVSSLDNVATYGKTYELGGPRVYTLRELVEFVIFVLGKKRKIVGLNDKLSYWQAYAMEKLPIKLMTRDNFYSMQVDSICNGPLAAELGIKPTAIEAVVPEYLANDTPRAAYDRFRGMAGR